ncbi:hypothetical protein [Eubacterium callanderi]
MLKQRTMKEERIEAIITKMMRLPEPLLEQIEIFIMAVDMVETARLRAEKKVLLQERKEKWLYTKH